MAYLAAIGDLTTELVSAPTADYHQHEPKPEHMARSSAKHKFDADLDSRHLGHQNQLGYQNQLGDEKHLGYGHHLDCRKHLGLEGDYVTLIGGESSEHTLHVTRHRADGARECFQWRKEAFSRELFQSQSGTDQFCQAFVDCNGLYLNGRALAMLGERSRSYLYSALHRLRQQGVIVIFDGHCFGDSSLGDSHCLQLWSHKAEACEAMLAIMQYTDIALLSGEGEKNLWGDDSIDNCKARYGCYDLAELVLTRNARDLILIAPNDQLPVSLPAPASKNNGLSAAVNKAFHAGYLAGRLQKKSVAESLQQGMSLVSTYLSGSQAEHVPTGPLTRLKATAVKSDSVTLASFKPQLLF